VSKRSGVNMAAVMDAARHCSQGHYLELREKAIRYVVNQMDRYLQSQREYRTGCIVRIKRVVAKFCCIVGGLIHYFTPYSLKFLILAIYYSYITVSYICEQSKT